MKAAVVLVAGLALMLPSGQCLCHIELKVTMHILSVFSIVFDLKKGKL